MSSFTVPYGVTSTALFIRVKAEANGEHYEGWGLIDTGSVDSGITETVVNKLNVVPIKGKEYHTANGKIVAPRYNISLTLQNNVVFSDIQASLFTNNGDGFDFLIGMDIISQGSLAVTNYNGAMRISFEYPAHGTIDFTNM
jgi:predicted aspartyl protease